MAEHGTYLLNGLNIHSNLLQLTRDGGNGGWGVVVVGYLCTTTYSLHCYHQNNSALRWAAVWYILTFHQLCGQSHKTVSIRPRCLKRKESWSGLNWGPSAFRPSALPLGHTSSQEQGTFSLSNLKSVQTHQYMLNLHHRSCALLDFMH